MNVRVPILIRCLPFLSILMFGHLRTSRSITSREPAIPPALAPSLATRSPSTPENAPTACAQPHAEKRTRFPHLRTSAAGRHGADSPGHESNIR